jgi:hypothetical protein
VVCCCGSGLLLDFVPELIEGIILLVALEKLYVSVLSRQNSHDLDVGLGLGFLAWFAGRHPSWVQFPLDLDCLSSSSGMDGYLGLVGRVFGI